MSFVTVASEGPLVWVTIDNPPVNATSTAVRAGILDAVERVRDHRLAVLRGAGRTFVAGGDMTEFDAPAQPPHLPDVVQAIEDSEVPFLCLLHGSVLGGGLEIAMACSYRIAAPGTQFGLPEVNVGLIPGAGGTQRAPRLFGWDASVEMACFGRRLGAEQALALGAIDAIAEDLTKAARAFVPRDILPVSKRPTPPMPADWLAQKRAAVEARAKGAKAPGHNLTALSWAAHPFAESQPKERALHLDLRRSEQSRALRHAFFAERAVARPAALGTAAPAEIRRIAVVGGGLMGAGIASTCLSAGYTVTVIERDKAAAKVARGRVEAILEGAVTRGKLSPEGAKTQRALFSTGDRYEHASEADLAIEAVFEDLEAKRTVFGALSEVVPETAILATNTSYLDPQAIFAGLPAPERCLGLHFFSPAHIMRLLEVVRLPETSEETLATGFALAKRLGKVAVMSGICDGFIGNRILATYRRAAEYMLADGALPQDIDAAMRAFGMAMGPFEAQDMSGLQIAEANRRRQDATRDPTERYVTIADSLCAQGRYGQRSGKGWYIYDPGSKSPKVDPEVTALIEDYAAHHGIPRRNYSPMQIQTQLLAAMANEGARIVAEGIAESDAAVDAVKIHGYGFPRWRGGPMHAASALGTEALKSALDQLDAASPGSWIRAERFA